MTLQEFEHERNAWSKLERELSAWRNAAEKLAEFASAFTQCSCCTETQKCAEGCTIEADLTSAGYAQDFKRMKWSREAMREFNALKGQTP